MRADAPERGQRDAAQRLRGLLRRAHELGAHLHIDMESLDSRDAVLELILALLAEEEFQAGPSAGVVLQAYLRDSPQTLDTIVEWIGGAGAGRRDAADRAAREGRLLGPRDRRGRPARLEAAGVRGQGGLRRQLRAAHAAADRPPRRRLRAAPGDRVAQPALGRPRDRLQPARRRQRRRHRAADPARARRRAAGGGRRPGPARARLLPGRRPRGRHGLPRPPAAGEHEQRLVPQRPGQRRAARAAARPADARHEGVHQRADPRAAAGADPRAARGRARDPRRQAAGAACRCGSATSAARATT